MWCLLPISPGTTLLTFEHDRAVGLEESRNISKLQLMFEFYGLQGQQHSDCPCGWNARYYHRLLRRYSQTLKYLVEQRELKEAFRWANTVTCPGHQHRFDECKDVYQAKQYSWVEEFVPSFETSVDEILSRREGLCLACVRGCSSIS